MSYDIKRVTPSGWVQRSTHAISMEAEHQIYGLGGWLAAFRKKEDAEFAVHCVNHHDELVEMLETALSWLDEVMEREAGGPAVFPEARALLEKVKS